MYIIYPKVNQVPAPPPAITLDTSGFMIDICPRTRNIVRPATPAPWTMAAAMNLLAHTSSASPPCPLREGSLFEVPPLLFPTSSIWVIGVHYSLSVQRILWAV